MHPLAYEPPSAGDADGRRLARWLAAATLLVYIPLGFTYVPQLTPLARFGIARFYRGMTLVDLIREAAYPFAVLGALVGIAGGLLWIATRRPWPVLIAAASIGVGIAGLFQCAFVIALELTGHDFHYVILLTQVANTLAYLLPGVLLLTPAARRMLLPSPTTTTTTAGEA